MSSRGRAASALLAALVTIAPASAFARGAFDATATPAQVCRLGYAHRHRKVSRRLRDAAYTGAGIPRGQRRGWVIDHYIPVELGGTNALANLVPEPRAEAKTKDRDENRLHAAVCSGAMTLAEARAEITRKWSR